MQATILGTGAYGLALGNLLHKKSQANIIFWTAFEKEYKEIITNHTHNKALKEITLEKDLNITMDLNIALNNTDLIIVAIPCNHVREVLIKIKDYLNDNSRVVLVSKGLEKNTELLMTEIYEELNLKGQVSYLAGPTFAKEIITNNRAGLTLGTKDLKTKEMISDLFRDTNIDIELTKDIIGLELYGVIKNVLAILMGSINCKYKNNSTSALYLTKICNFTQNLVAKLGGDKDTINCYGGLGDILLTCNSENSRNYSYGCLLYKDYKKANKYKEQVTVEGSIAIASLIKLLRRQENESTIFFEKLSDYTKGITTLDEVLEYL